MSEEQWLRVIAILGAVLLVAAGLVLLHFVRIRWHGSYRQWAVAYHGPHIVYTVPALGVAVIATGVALLLPLDVARYVWFLALVFLIVSIFASTSQPRWWGPDWYHEVRRELIIPNQDAWQAPLAIVPDDGVSLSPEELADKVFDGQPVAVRWNGHLVEENNFGLRKYGVREVTERAMTLEVRPNGLAFLPSWLTKKFSGQPHILPIRAEEVERVWVVRPGADPNGVVPRGIPHRWSHRVVIQTERGTFLFAVADAHDRAKTISEVLGCPLLIPAS